MRNGWRAAAKFLLRGEECGEIAAEGALEDDAGGDAAAVDGRLVGDEADPLIAEGGEA